MKKFLIPLVAIVALLVALIYFLTKHAPHSSRVADLAPADSIAFFHVPDWARTRERWPKTALSQILNEPEVQAFLEKPLSKIPRHDDLQKRSTQIAQINPREAFFAVTALGENNVPKFVTGFSYRGKKEDVKALLADLRKSAQNAWPAGKSDLAEANGTEIETFTNGKMTAAAAFKEDWLFLADDLDLLKTTLDRFDGKGTNALRDSANFKTAVSHMPMDFDALSFVQPQIIADRLAALALSANPSADPHSFDEFKKIQALAGATKLEDENIRDTMFVLKPGQQKKDTLAQHGLALTAADTLGYYAARLQKPANFQMPNQAALDTLGFMRFVQPILDAAKTQGLSGDDFWTAFGPEVSMVVDWAASSQIPAPLLAFDVQDKAKAQRFVDALTQANTGVTWARQVVDGTPFYQLPQSGFAMVQIAPTLAMTDKFVLIGLSLDSVKGALARLNSGEAKLDKAPGFQKVAAAVHPPSMAYGFVDARAWFERVYGPLRPFAMMWAAFIKGSGDYVEVSKLPATETISKHLGPIVFSSSALENGAISESVGPVTSTQALLGLGLGAGVAAVPYFQKQFAPAPVTGAAPSVPGGVPLPPAQPGPTPSPAAAVPPAEPLTTP